MAAGALEQMILLLISNSPQGSEGVTKCHWPRIGTKSYWFQLLEVAYPEVERVDLKFLHKPFPTKLLAVTWHLDAASLPLGLVEFTLSFPSGHEQQSKTLLIS
jgi:hypothetical protein